jgi:hypothetical protein
MKFRKQNFSFVQFYQVEKVCSSSSLPHPSPNSHPSESQHLRKVRHRLNQSAVTNKITEKLQILFYENISKNILHGSYSSEEATRRTYQMETILPHESYEDEKKHEGEGDDERNLTEMVMMTMATTATTTTTTSTRTSSNKKNKKKAIVSSELNELMEENPSEHGSGSGSVSGTIDDLEHLNQDMKARSRADKQDQKKKWLVIQKTFSNLRSSIHSSGYGRPTFESLHESMELAYRSLPVPTDVVLGGSLDENLQEVFQFLLEVIPSSTSFLFLTFSSSSSSEIFDLQRMDC